MEKGLEILIQNVIDIIDIGAHLLASEIKNDWEDYGEVIMKLRKHRAIPQEISDSYHFSLLENEFQKPKKLKES